MTEIETKKLTINLFDGKKLELEKETDFVFKVFDDNESTKLISYDAIMYVNNELKQFVNNQRFKLFKMGEEEPVEIENAWHNEVLFCLIEPNYKYVVGSKHTTYKAEKYHDYIEVIKRTKCYVYFKKNRRT